MEFLYSSHLTAGRCWCLDKIVAILPAGLFMGSISLFSFSSVYPFCLDGIFLSYGLSTIIV